MKLEKIVMHWSAGGHEANAKDRRHYHEIVEGDGSRVLGDYLLEANISIPDGRYAAHTRKFNSRAIGLSMAAMVGAKHESFKEGSSPITKMQLAAFVEMVAEYADTYNIPIDRKHVLTHAEVWPIHRVW